MILEKESNFRTMVSLKALLVNYSTELIYGD